MKIREEKMGEFIPMIRVTNYTDITKLKLPVVITSWLQFPGERFLKTPSFYQSLELFNLSIMEF